jgi:multisubunit Na+/H+ antiporter MnhB subunit
MLSLLYVLINIYQKLEIGKNLSGTQSNILVRGPFQLYLGWISVATIANFAAFLISIGVVLTIGIQQIIALGLMLVVLYIAFKMRKERKDVIYPSVIAWALIGIGAKYVNDEREGVWIALPAFMIAGIIILLTILLSFKSLNKETQFVK